MTEVQMTIFKITLRKTSLNSAVILVNHAILMAQKVVMMKLVVAIGLKSWQQVLKTYSIQTTTFRKMVDLLQFSMMAQKPHEIIENIMDNEFFLMCIEGTNEHWSTDPKFVGEIGEISKDDKGIAFLRGFFAVKWQLLMYS